MKEGKEGLEGCGNLARCGCRDYSHRSWRDCKTSIFNAPAIPSSYIFLISSGYLCSSAEHNLPDSPFASSAKSAFAAEDSSIVSEAEPSAAASASSALLASTLLPATSTLESMATFKSCFFQMPRSDPIPCLFRNRRPIQNSSF